MKLKSKTAEKCHEKKRGANFEARISKLKITKSRTFGDVRRLCGDDRVDVAVFHLSGCFGWGFKGGFLFSLSSVCLTSASQKAQNRSVEDYDNNFWLLLSAEQMSKRSLLNYKQLSNRFGVQHLPDWMDIPREFSSCFLSGLDQQVTCFTCFTLAIFSFIWRPPMFQISRACFFLLWKMVKILFSWHWSRCNLVKLHITHPVFFYASSHQS